MTDQRDPIYITITDGMYLHIARPYRRNANAHPKRLMDNITPASKRRLLREFAKHEWSHGESSDWRYAGLGYDMVTLQEFATYRLTNALDEIDLVVWLGYEWDVAEAQP